MFALSVAGLGLLHAVVWVFLRKILLINYMYSQFIYYLAVGLAIVSWLLLTEDAELSLLSLSAVLVISAILTAVHYRVVMFGIAVISSLVMPATVAGVVPGDGSASYLQFVSVYLLIVGLLLWVVRYVWRHFRGRVIVLQLAYGFCILTAWGAGLSTGEFLWQLFVSLVVFVTIVAISVYDKYPTVLYGLPVIGFVVLAILLDRIFPAMRWDEVAIYASLFISAILYLGSLLVGRLSYRLPLVVSMITGGALVWTIIFLSSTEGLYTFSYTAPVVLILTSSVLLFEKTLLKGGPLFALLPYFGFTLALMQVIDVTWVDSNVLVYSHILVVYGLASSYIVSRHSVNQELIAFCKYTTLAIYTLPVAVQALASGGIYSIVLLFEQLALVVLGVAANRAYLVYWGAAVSILSVIYLLRSFFYLQLLISAVILIGYAVHRLSHKKI